MNLRIPIEKALAHKFAAVDLLLRDGSVIENLAVDASGQILGKVVGGQDGVDESPLPFGQQDIQAYRFRAGLAARLGIAKWRQLERAV
jgi:hypothetical protein